jgi:hypothetical protein
VQLEAQPRADEQRADRRTLMACRRIWVTGLNDIGFSIPAQGATYWNGEAMRTKDYNDLEKVPEAVAKTTAAAARNAHLASVLRGELYPPYQ